MRVSTRSNTVSKNSANTITKSGARPDQPKSGFGDPVEVHNATKIYNALQDGLQRGCQRPCRHPAQTYPVTFVLRHANRVSTRYDDTTRPDI